MHYFSSLREDIIKQNDELIWSEVWHDTIKGIKWWDNDIPSISPGRWAVGYNYLYVMTRILNDFTPLRILEFGLGISTTLISKYFSTISETKNCYHMVMEHDDDWINFYVKSHPISCTTKIRKQKLITEKLTDGRILYRYQDISKDVLGMNFQVISIDAPFGGDMNSRADILKFLPEILDDEFVIIIDDANRKAEKETVEKIRFSLSESNIETAYAVYRGMTDVAVIASQGNRFLCSL